MPKAMPTHSLPLQGLFPIAKPSGPPSCVKQSSCSDAWLMDLG